MPDTDPSSTETDADKAQAEIDKWKAMARKHEQAARENAGAAEKLAALEAATQTKEEKLAADLAAETKRADGAVADSLRWRIAAKHGISDEDAELFLLGTDEGTLTKQAERLAGKAADTKKAGPVVPKEGQATAEPKEDETKAFARSLFNPTPA